MTPLFAATWEESFALLTAFKAQEGHFHVPKSFVRGSVRLNSWLQHQRKFYKSGRLLEARQHTSLLVLSVQFRVLSEVGIRFYSKLMTLDSKRKSCAALSALRGYQGRSS